jgi:hypothetical protein
MKIRSSRQYKKALERYDLLISAGHTTVTCRELADIEAAMHSYGLPPDKPATTPGRPTADPYGLQDREQKRKAASFKGGSN